MSGRRSPRDDDPVIKVRGLPYEATALDMCKFFDDCKIKAGPRGIYFCIDDRKRPTGEAYIKMTSFRDVDNALRRHRDRMGQRYVEVFESRAGVLEEEVEKGATNEFGFNENRKDRGRLDISRPSDNRFSGGRDRDYDGGYGRDRDFGGRGNFGRDGGGGGYGRNNGGSFGRDGGGSSFGRGGGGGRSFRDRSPPRSFGGGGGRDRSFDRDRKPVTHLVPRRRDNGPPKSEASKWCVKLRGLPWSATKDEIVDFLSDCNVLNGKKGVIILMEDGRDRPSGDAYVELEEEQDIKEAIKQHKQNMGSRYVEVFEANGKDVARAKDREMAQEALKNGFTVNLRGLPYSATEDDIEEWLKEAADPIEVHIEEERQGRPSGRAVAYFRTEEEAEKVVEEMHKRDMGTRYIECIREEGRPSKRARLNSGSRERSSSH